MFDKRFLEKISRFNFTFNPFLTVSHKKCISFLSLSATLDFVIQSIEARCPFIKKSNISKRTIGISTLRTVCRDLKELWFVILVSLLHYERLLLWKGLQLDNIISVYVYMYKWAVSLILCGNVITEHWRISLGTYCVLFFNSSNVSSFSSLF